MLRNGRELVRGSIDEEPGVADYVERLDFAGPGDELWQRMLRHEVSERAYWAQRAGEIGQLFGHADWSTYDLITWLYDRPEVHWLNHEVVELILDTKAAGLPVVALTNDLVDFHGQAWADAQDWLKHFDAVVDGSLTGVLKPAHEAYRIAIAETGVPATEIVYLDDMPWNVAGGLAVGLQAIEVRYDDRHAAVIEARRRLGLAPTDS